MCQSVSFSQHSAALLEVSRKTDFPPYEAPSYFSAVNSAVLGKVDSRGGRYCHPGEDGNRSGPQKARRIRRE